VQRSDRIKISIARQIHVLRVWSEEQNAWIRAIRTCAPETRGSGSSATEMSEGHALRMPSSAREVVLPPADDTAMLAVGWIKAAKLIDDQH
jgi:hypothetical protein